MRCRASSPLLVAALLALACSPRTPAAQRARLEAERRALEEQLDALEDRLLVNQARVRFWTELRERHQGVTAIACASQERHAEEMARLLLSSDPRRAGLRASAGVPSLGHLAAAAPGSAASGRARTGASD